MKFYQVLLAAAVGALVALGAAQFLGGTQKSPAMEQKETAFERVMRTNTLRCGYYMYVPVTIRDPNTGELSGLSVDMMDYFSRKTGIKVEWTEEITFGNWAPALQAGRFDAVCTPIWPDVSFYRAAKFTRPFLITDRVPVVRADETRFGPDLESFNNPSVTIGVMEGDSSQAAVRALFPKAKISALPSSSDYGLLLQSLIEKKVDMVPWERNSIYQFELHNPGKVKALEMNEPIGIMPSTLVVGASESDLRDMLDGLIEDLMNVGLMRKMTEKWLPPGIVFMPAKLYDPDSMKKGKETQ